MESNYTFKKSYPYVETSVFKQKEVSCINNLVVSGRLKHLIKFEGYGVCEYDEDDKQQINTHVIMTDKFNRLRTNIMVFDVFENDWSNGVYDKMFIFKTNYPKETVFNIVFHNTKTGRTMHHPEIEYAYDTLAQDIMKVFNTCHVSEIIRFYREKNRCIRDNEFSNDISIKSLEPLLEKYNNAQWDDFNELRIAE